MAQQNVNLTGDTDVGALHAGMLQQNHLAKKKYRSKFLKRPILATLQKLMVAYLVVWSISPPLAIDMIYRYIALACAGGWLVIEMSRRRKFERIHGFAIAFMLAVMAIALAESGGNFSALLKQISYYMLVIGFLMNYSYRDRWDEFKLLVPLVLILWTVFNVISAREVIADPSLARKIVRVDEEIYPYIRRGVGGYALVYSQVFVFPIMIGWIRNTLKRDLRLLAFGAAWLVSFLVFLLNAGYSIAIVTTISSTVILILYRKRSAIPAIVITLSIIVLIVILIGYVDPVREALLSYFDGTAVAKKIRDTYDSIHGIETADSIQERIDLYVASLNTIISYPIIGGLWWGSGGGHSAILDTFAKYGLWGGWFFCSMIYSVPLNLKRISNHSRDLRIANAFLSSLILVTLLDSLPYEMIFPVMIVSPILIHQMRKWRMNEDLTPVEKLKGKFIKHPKSAQTAPENKKGI